jgi:hypothetical protein
MQRAIYLRVTGRLHACLHVGCWASIRGDRAFGITSIEAISLAGALPACAHCHSVGASERWPGRQVATNGRSPRKATSGSALHHQRAPGTTEAAAGCSLVCSFIGLGIPTAPGS